MEEDGFARPFADANEDTASQLNVAAAAVAHRKRSLSEASIMMRDTEGTCRMEPTAPAPLGEHGHSGSARSISPPSGSASGPAVDGDDRCRPRRSATCGVADGLGDSKLVRRGAGQLEQGGAAVARRRITCKRPAHAAYQVPAADTDAGLHGESCDERRWACGDTAASESPDLRAVLIGHAAGSGRNGSRTVQALHVATQPYGARSSDDPREGSAVLQKRPVATVVHTALAAETPSATLVTTQPLKRSAGAAADDATLRHELAARRIAAVRERVVARCRARASADSGAALDDQARAGHDGGRGTVRVANAAGDGDGATGGVAPQGSANDGTAVKRRRMRSKGPPGRRRSECDEEGMKAAEVVEEAERENGPPGAG